MCSMLEVLDGEETAVLACRLLGEWLIQASISRLHQPKSHIEYG